MLCLIIFLWTPPHFWALALYRAEDYRSAGLPMLPVTHGSEFTRLHVLLYTLRAVRRHAAAVRLRHERLALPGRGAWCSARGSSATRWRCGAATATRWRAAPSASRSVHLSLLFAALLVDHYLAPWLEPDRCRLRRRCWLLALRGAAGRLRPRRRRKPQFKAIDITGADYARELRAARCRRQAAHAGRLQGQGRRWSSSASRSARTSARPRWPSWRRSSDALGADGDRVQGVFVTVDPERDTPSVLKAYVEQLRPELRRAARHAEQTQAVAKEFKVLLRQGARQDRRQLHGRPHRRRVTSSTRRAGSGCSRATAAAPKALARRHAATAAEREQRLTAETAPQEPLRRCAGSRSGRGFERLAHLLHRRHLDLADALGADAVLGGQLVQRHAARASRRSPSASAPRRCGGCVRRACRAPARCRRRPAGRGGALRARASARCCRRPGRRSARKLSSPSSVCGSSATSPPDRRVSISTTSSRLDVQLRARRVSTSPGVSVLRCVSPSAASPFRPCFIERRLKNSLRCALVVATLTMRQLLQDVLVDLGLDPVQRVADQPHALLGVEALDGLHQADVAFLDQVAVRQAVAQVLARHRHDQPQVRQHQPAGGLQVALVAQLARQVRLVFCRQHRHAVDRRDVRVEVAQRRHQGPGVAQCNERKRRLESCASEHRHPELVPRILAL